MAKKPTRHFPPLVLVPGDPADAPREIAEAEAALVRLVEALAVDLARRDHAEEQAENGSREEPFSRGSGKVPGDRTQGP